MKYYLMHVSIRTKYQNFHFEAKHQWKHMTENPEITSLVTLQLLTLVGHDDQLDGPKYKCTVSLDFIRAIARTVNFDIIKYLYDFL
ncbi:origin recognition complex subunit 5 [Trichechus manatus latirostris]|uniref:Origin recognition complex subunit 5 n=1 Tax=Trichechus manatus latirostris TaxID=127582 RepID=A0A2Y9QHN3_TRIMA|nr:origin recognition complex subunit 5 [Trichechus manatus latirostris]